MLSLLRKFVLVVLAIYAATFILKATAEPAPAPNKNIRLPYDIDKMVLVGGRTTECDSGRSFVGFVFVDPDTSEGKYLIIIENIGNSTEIRVVVERVVAEGLDDSYLVKVWTKQMNVPTEVYTDIDAFSKRYPTPCQLPQTAAAMKHKKKSNVREF